MIVVDASVVAAARVYYNEIGSRAGRLLEAFPDPEAGGLRLFDG